MKRIFIYGFLTLLALACTQENFSPEGLPADGQVVFSPALPGVGAITKLSVASQSASDTAGVYRELLRWDSGDAFRVWSTAHPERQTEYSHGQEGAWTSEDPLTWSGGVTQTFYAVRPYTLFNRLDVNRVSAAVSAVQNPSRAMENYLLVSAKGPEAPSESVVLPFTPLSTLCTFVLNNATTAPVTLTAATLRGEQYLSGSLVAQIRADGNHVLESCPSAGTGSYTIAADFSASGGSLAIAGNSRTELSFVVLPNVSGKLSLELTFAGGRKEFAVTEIPSGRLMYHKYTHVDLVPGSTPVEGGEYYLDVYTDTGEFNFGSDAVSDLLNLRVVSYKVIAGERLQTTAVPFRVEYFNGDRGSAADFADNAKWLPVQAYTPSGTYAASNRANKSKNWITTTQATFAGGVSNLDAAAVSLRASSSHSEALPGAGAGTRYASYLAQSTHRSGLFNLDPSKPETAVDLSLYDATGKFITKGRSTANCYVINAPGWYKFPAVYGNAVIHGAVERQTFTDGTQRLGDSFDGSSSRGWLDYFEGKSHLVENAAEAKLIWQDGQGVISGNNDSSLAPRLVKNEDGFDFVYFYISPATVQACNAVIGVRDSAGNILWSWHIWVTPHLMETGDQKLSTMFVGWVDTESTTASYSYARGEIVRIVQLKADLSAPDPAGKVRCLTLSQKPSSLLGGTRYISQGRNSYYQLCRKDPFFSTKGGASTEYVKVWDGDGNMLIGDNVAVSSSISYNSSLLGSGPFFTITESSRPSFTWEQTIRMPWHFYLSGQALLNNETMNWGGRVNASTNYRGTSLGALKSVVDPSPYGFRTFEFSFNQNHSTWWGEGVTYCPAADTYYIPATGQMRGTSGFTINNPLTSVYFFRFSVRSSSNWYFVSAGFREIRQNSTTHYLLNYGHMLYNPIRPVFDPESE